MTQQLTLTVTKRKFYNLVSSLGYDVFDFDFCTFSKQKNWYCLRTVAGDFTLTLFCGNVLLNRRVDGKLDNGLKLTLEQIEKYKLVKVA